MDNEITEKYPLHEYEFELTEKDVKLFKEQAYIRTVNLINSHNNDKKVWVHTCALDHKFALANYISRGLKVFKKEQIDLVA